MRNLIFSIKILSFTPKLRISQFQAQQLMTSKLCQTQKI